MREAVRKHPAITVTVTTLCILAVAVRVIRSRSVSPPLVTPATYYTCDDGKTVFKDDDPHHIAPFDYQGQEAVQVFFVPGRTVGNPDSIWYLRKLTAARKKQMESMPATSDGPSPECAPGSPSPFAGQLIKRPGDPSWIPMDDPRAAKIFNLQ